MPQDINSVLSNKDFQSASPEVQEKFLTKHFPDFGSASPEARQAFIKKHTKKSEDTESFIYGVKQTLPSLKELRSTGRGLLGFKEDESILKGVPIGKRFRTALGTLKDIGSNIFEQQKAEYRKSKELQEDTSGTTGEQYARGVKAAGHLGASLLPIFGPMAASAGEDIGTGHVQRGMGKAAGTIGQVLAPKVIGKGLKAAPAAIMGLKSLSGIVPEIEVIEGVGIPRLASEVRPKSFGGRAVEGAKKLGLNEKGFKEFAEKQNQAVKQVIKEVAQKTAKKTFPDLLDNPADALNKAAGTVEVESRAMYKALDATVDQIPGGGYVLIEGLTPVIKKVLAKFPVNQAALPGGDILIDAKGIAFKLIENAESVTTPFQTAQELRSALLKAARKATDANMRRLIFEGVEEIDSGMEDALKKAGNSGVTDLWREANKGWAKKYALNEVANVVNKAIKGSPAEISDVPPTMSAKPLANSLNELSTRYGKGPSVMERAFGTDDVGKAHIMSIRRAVALLEQAQKVKAGSGFGKMRFAAHGVMAAGGLMTGHIGYAGAAMAVELSAEQLSKAMTSLKGARAVERLLKETSPKQAALLRAAVVAAAAEHESHGATGQY